MKVILGFLICLAMSSFALAQQQISSSSASTQTIMDDFQHGHGGGHPVGHGGGGHPVGHPGFHGGGGFHDGHSWHPHAGWHAGWRWNRGYYPRWWHVGIVFPGWYWIDVPVGYWQCTAFDEARQPYTAIGPDNDQAAYGALTNCGGPNYEGAGCFIPPGYCRLR